MKHDITNFIIFCIENYKNYKKFSGNEVVQIFDDFGVFDYLSNHYNVLHSTCIDYLNKDIDEYINIRTQLSSQ